jgi:LPXTG-site transpeptidase (sortase) family protein
MTEHSLNRPSIIGEIMDTSLGSIHRKAGNAPIWIQRIIPMLLCAIILSWMVVKPWMMTNAATTLEVTPVTWNVVGLDDTLLTTGPDTYQVGGRVCNVGADPATNVVVVFFWDTPNNNINRIGTGTLHADSIAANTCQDFIYAIAVSRDQTAYNSTRQYHIEVTADNIGTISTTKPREIFVQPLSARADLTINSLTGPTQVLVGQSYSFVMQGTLGTAGYQQLEHLINFPSDKLHLTSVTARYPDLPANNDKSYADACGWNNDPITSTYRTCLGPPNFDAGKITGTIVTTYTFNVLSSGTITLTGLLYGYSNNGYFYNGNYGQNNLVVTAANPTPTPTASLTPSRTLTTTATLTQTQTATPTPTLTGTQPTPTFTGTIVPSPGVTKGVSPSYAYIGYYLTFTIKVVNTGSAPAYNVTLTDSFAAYNYLDIYSLVTTQGTTSYSGRVATVTIGTLMPNVPVTVTITIYVNSLAYYTTSPCNTASLSYTGGTPRVSNTTCFTVYGSSTLPGTGEDPRPMPAASSSSTLLSTLLLGLVGLAVLFLIIKLVLWVRANSSAKARIYAIGALFFMVALVGAVMLITGGKQGRDEGSQISMEMSTQTAGAALASTASATINPLAVLPAYLFATPGTSQPIETLPSYPIPTPSSLPTSGPGGKEADTSPIVRIVIPALKLDAVVAYVPFDGHTWMIQGLRLEVAWLGETSWPGLGGNTALAGHVTVRDLGNGPFRFLFDLKQGDEVKLYTEKNIYAYHVRDKREVDISDLSVTAKTDHAQVTLITCVEWSETLDTYTNRYIVTGDLASVEPIIRTQGN